MNPPLPRTQAAFQSALKRVHRAAREVGERCTESLGISALSSHDAAERDALLTAQFDLNRNIASFEFAFGEKLNEQIQREFGRADGGAPPRPASALGWDTLSLVGDDEVEAQVRADRIAQSIRHGCEWELRELDAYMGSLLQLDNPDRDRNPLRPELICKALVHAADSVSERAEVRKTVVTEIGRSLATTMPRVYGEVIADLRNSGLQPLSLTLRTVQGAPAHSRHTSGYSTGHGALSARGELPGAGRAAAEAGDSTRRAAGDAARTFGQVDAQLMSLIRQLARVSLAPAGAQGTAGGLAAGAAATDWGGAAVPNLIYAHRDELRRASTGTLDHMVIDVVGSLFEQILSDPKVPPQMARQIARLQLPVLRVALGDATFFSSRRHPVRRFVNRIASLACGFDDLAAGPGDRFLALVRELVQHIVEGDFDQMALYERKLSELEAFIAGQATQEVQEHAGDAAQLFADKEQALLLHQRYMRRLQSELAPLAMPEFLRTFVAQVWSQAIVLAERQHGEGSERALKARQAAHDLVLSVLPKGTPAERKAFVLALPPLMKELNDGLARIGWPEDAKKAFFAQLLPAHAESLKSGAVSQLDYNLLAKKLDAVFGAPLPNASERPPPGVLPVLDDVVPERNFSADEARRVGLVTEAAVDWNGQVDIDLSAEPEVSTEDVRIEGLPAPDAVEPASGAALAQHVQVGFAYRMHLEGAWHKVKLNYISPARTFFVFTRGAKHQRTISLTARMLMRLCESGRLRTFENAYLLERATARARKQLAALGAGRPAASR